MRRIKIFLPGYKFTSYDVIEGVRCEYTVVSRMNDIVKCELNYCMDKELCVEEKFFKCNVDQYGHEFIVLSENGGYEIKRFADNLICTYEACKCCTMIECTVGQIARKFGEEKYEEYVTAYSEFKKSLNKMEEIESQLDDSVLGRRVNG